MRSTLALVVLVISALSSSVVSAPAPLDDIVAARQFAPPKRKATPTVPDFDQHAKRAPQASKRAPQASKRAPQASKRAPMPSKRAPVPQVLKRAPQASKRAERRAPQASKRAPQASKRAERRAPQASKRAPQASKRAPQASKRAERRAPQASKRAKREAMPEATAPPQLSERSFDEQTSFEEYVEQSEMNLSEMLCPGDQTACPVSKLLSLPTSLVGWSEIEYECFDFSADLKACGGCGSMNSMYDCTTIADASSVACVQGSCQVSKCKQGFVPSGLNSCIPASHR
ncbi:hypothetical protein JAAARDRAFT_366825 [Jaapia argillacea MUCL 33604]|uniref:Protein CPL1-like domain-containing protein n=1 Tax=Jaapia argillacea MUCL 33604 TaxID=933084 RepID=A0A067Q7S9_9AGAM|nr:hypothetical protein JAAARDRAFT_366825 [Jaapia argillacea MUCL 33604]